MKKFLSVILASLIITAAGCSDSEEASTTTAAETTTTAEAELDAEAETTTAAEEEAEETTTTAAETEAETTTEASETEAEEADGELMTDEIKAFIAEIEDEVPIYADYMKKTCQLPINMGFAYEADLYGTGEMSTTTMDIYMSAMDKMYVSTVTDGVAADIIINGDTLYMISDEEKTAIYMTMSEEELAEMSESMTASVKPAFDASAATFETGETEYNGETYLYEKIITEEAGEVIVYADTATKEIEYIESAGVVMELTALTNDFDESIYEIPADYTLVDMATLYQ